MVLLRGKSFMYIRKITVNETDRVYQIFLDNYREESKISSLLPSPDQFLSGENSLNNIIRNNIDRGLLDHPGFVIFDSQKEERLLGFMITGPIFDFKGQKTVIVPEYCHGTLGNHQERKLIYQRLYQKCSQIWVDQGCFLHLIGSFYHDEILKNTLFHLGFGAIIAERLRDLSHIEIKSSGTYLPVTPATDVDDLIEIEREHNLFYPESPVFITKSTDREEIRRNLENHFEKGDIIFTCRDNDKVQGYLTVGESEENGEGFLLRKTNTAQIKSAFVYPEYRGREIGAALLHKAVEWSGEQGYDRIFVEHETANIFGGNFWAKYFEPYLVFSMRYVENISHN
jgi:GNAT superfamily N-acetyltransferase